MEQAVFKQALSIPIHAPYLDILSIVKRIVESTYFLRFISPSLSKYPVFINELDQCDIGTEFSLFFENRINIYFRLVELVETDYWAHIEYLAYRTYPNTFTYSFVLNVHYISPSICIVFSSFTYPKSVNLPIEARRKEQERRVRMFRNVERMVMNKEHTKFNIEYVLIKAKMNLVWELMLNMKSFNRLVKLLSDDIEYEGKELEKGKRVRLVYNIGKRTLIQEVEVSKVNESENECEIEFYLKENEKESIPEQKISLLIYKGENDHCVLYMFNIFNMNIDEKLQREMSNKKKNMLNKIKKIVESYVNINNKFCENVSVH